MDLPADPPSERGTVHNNPGEFGRTALHEDEDGGSKTVDGGNDDIPDGMPDVETAVRDLRRLIFDTGRGGGQSELALWFDGTVAPAGTVEVSCSVRIVLLPGPFAGANIGRCPDTPIRFVTTVPSGREALCRKRLIKADRDLFGP